jgi:hypothetical protein
MGQSNGRFVNEQVKRDKLLAPSSSTGITSSNRRPPLVLLDSSIAQKVNAVAANNKTRDTPSAWRVHGSAIGVPVAHAMHLLRGEPIRSSSRLLLVRNIRGSIKIFSRRITSHTSNITQTTNNNHNHTTNNNNNNTFRPITRSYWHDMS